MSRILKVVFGFVLAAGLWFWLAPQQLGGPVVYTVTTGNSMEPLLHEGDLAIVREQPTYGIGDAVAYRSERLGRTVLHRIVDVDDTRYVFKGDNNDFLDPEHLGSDQVMGTLWVHVPKVGHAFRFLQTPMGLGGVGVLLAGLLGLFGVRKRRGRVVKPRHAAPKSVTLPVHPINVRRPEQKGVGARKLVRTIALSTIGTFVLSLGFGALTYGSPPTRTESSSVRYRHAGTFAYTTAAPPGPAYDGPGIVTGEPVFLKLVDEVTLSFDYAFDTRASHDVDLAGNLVAKLSAPNGFARTIELPTDAVVVDDQLQLAAPLDLAALKKLVREVERSTGVEQSIYDLRIVPAISVNGTVSDRPFEETFSPELKLHFDGLQLLAERDVHGEVPADMVDPVEMGDISVSGEVPGYIAAMGVKVPLPVARRIAAGGAGASVLILLVSALALLLVLPRDEASRIYARYGSMLVSVDEMPVADHDTIDVPRIATLVKLGQRFEEPILHHTSRQSHSYLVFHDGLLYRYRLALAEPLAA
ncbi:MAG TPA: signal peptidase I [Actinomycetota bacterium]|nr:signal peptidase I [Actinomycetota bacterium]